MLTLLTLLTGILLAIVASWLAFQTPLWWQKRHDYGELLCALDKGNNGELLKRLDLVALIGSKPVRDLANTIRETVLASGQVGRANSDASESPELAANGERWRKSLLHLMRQDIEWTRRTFGVIFVVLALVWAFTWFVDSRSSVSSEDPETIPASSNINDPPDLAE